MPLIRSISGLRGTIGDSLTPETLCRYVAAFAAYCGPGPVAVGRDGRPAGAWIEQIVAGTLRACRRDVRLLGVVPTPTVQMVTETTDAAGGISITASHNPSPWNGLKFLNAEGVFLDADECDRFFPMVDSALAPLAGWDESGGVEYAQDETIEAHINAALALPFVNLPALQSRGFRVVVDAVNASGSLIVPRLLERCGCTVTPLFCDGSGVFPHTPEPLPENLTDLSRAVRLHKADFGVAVDPDADRLVLIDENGDPIGEEYTITQAAAFVLDWHRRQNPDALLSVAVNLSTTRAVDDVAALSNATVLRTPVGEINVVRAMKSAGSVIGGEGSGGVILPALHYGRDSLAGITITLAHMLHHGGTMSALKAALPQYSIVKHRADLKPGADIGAILERVAASVTDGRVNTLDGLRIDFPQSWVHLRGSNTEPIARVIAEAPTPAEADALAAQYAELLQTQLYD